MDYKKLLEEVGFTSSGKPLSFTAFKTNCTAMVYKQRGNKSWIIYYGQPNKQMVKVYPFMGCCRGEHQTKAENVREAYDQLIDLAKTGSVHGYDIEACQKYSMSY